MRLGNGLIPHLLMPAVAASIVLPADARAGQKAVIGSPVSSGRRCTTDGLIHADVTPEITKRVTGLIKPLEKGLRIREIAKLSLPCGYHLDPRYGWNLILANGTEIRRYMENTGFGFAPAFGFGDQAGKPYTLNYRLVAAGELHPDGCVERLATRKTGLLLCTGFGSDTSFFGAARDTAGTRLSHYVLRDGALQEDFAVADIGGTVESIFFLPPPDAPGGTITLILTDPHGTYRAFLDTPKG